MNELFDLTGKVAAVTGAGGVLCGQMAKALASAGAKVAVLDLSQKQPRKSLTRLTTRRNCAGGQMQRVR